MLHNAAQNTKESKRKRGLTSSKNIFYVAIFVVFFMLISGAIFHRLVLFFAIGIFAIAVKAAFLYVKVNRQHTLHDVEKAAHEAVTEKIKVMARSDVGFPTFETISSNMEELSSDAAPLINKYFTEKIFMIILLISAFSMLVFLSPTVFLALLILLGLSRATLAATDTQSISSESIKVSNIIKLILLSFAAGLVALAIYTQLPAVGRVSSDLFYLDNIMAANWNLLIMFILTAGAVLAILRLIPFGSSINKKIDAEINDYFYRKLYRADFETFNSKIIEITKEVYDSMLQDAVITYLHKNVVSKVLVHARKMRLKEPKETHLINLIRNSDELAKLKAAFTQNMALRNLERGLIRNWSAEIAIINKTNEGATISPELLYLSYCLQDAHYKDDICEEIKNGAISDEAVTQYIRREYGDLLREIDIVPETEYYLDFERLAVLLFRKSVTEPTFSFYTFMGNLEIATSLLHDILGAISPRAIEYAREEYGNLKLRKPEEMVLRSTEKIIEYVLKASGTPLKDEYRRAFVLGIIKEEVVFKSKEVTAKQLLTISLMRGKRVEKAYKVVLG